MKKNYWRLAAISLLTLLITASVNAYTLVMRDGRRVEIPNDFIVNNSTLTYRVSSDIQVTVQLVSIDIAATERLNGRPVASIVNGSRAVVETRATRTITNQDLESFRKTRVESEAAYEKRRKELGLPSPEETRRRLEVISEEAQEQLLRSQTVEQQSENYWRSRATALRSEINAADARMSSIRQRLEEMAPEYSFGAFTTLLPFGQQVGRVKPIGHRGVRPSIYSSRVVGTSVGVRVGVPIGRARLSINARRFDGFATARPVNPFGYPLLTVPFQTADYGLERINLVNQLNELTTYRAGLQSRWRDLEDEARRAGAYPGWLRQ